MTETTTPATAAPHLGITIVGLLEGSKVRMSKDGNTTWVELEIAIPRPRRMVNGEITGGSTTYLVKVWDETLIGYIAKALQKFDQNANYRVAITEGRMASDHFVTKSGRAAGKVVITADALTIHKN